MHALTEQRVRRSFVNCSQGEATGLGLPRDFADLDWWSLELLGWRDPKAPSSLFTAKRTGAAGRNVTTVGTYVCADLGCADRVRTDIPAWLRDRDPAEVAAERAAELRERVHAFVEAVRR